MATGAFVRRSWALALVIAVLGPASAQTPQVRRFTILHTNDLHGRLLPFHYAERGRDRETPVICGGAARRATLIRQLRREISDPTLLVDAGDIFTRGALTNAYEGLADVAAMNATGYDLAAIGNNEFKAKDAADAEDAAGSQAALLRVVRKSRFPWLCANLTDKAGRPLPGVRPYAMRRIAGLRVAFLSVTAPRSAGYPQTRGRTISDPIEAAARWAARLRPRCDVLIALTHIGYELDKRLAQTVPGIDAVVGGDSHTFLYEATWVDGPSGARVPIVQAGEYGVNVGRFDLRFERAGDGWKLMDAASRLIPVTANLPADRAVERALAPYVRPFMAVLGSIGSPGESPQERARVTTELLVAALRRQLGADLAMNPAGQGLVDVLHAADVRRYDLYAAMPFRNRSVVALLTGAEIEAMRQRHPTTVTDGPAGVEPSRVYRVAMVDYVAQGGYGVSATRIIERGDDVRVIVERELRSRTKPIAATSRLGAAPEWSAYRAAPAM